MKSHGNLFLDLLSILPPKLDCYIQVPSLEDETIKSLMIETEYPYFKLLKISDQNIDKIANSVLRNHLTDYINSIQIQYENELLFEGFDGIEFGVISEFVLIPEWFRGLYNIEDRIVNTK